MMLNPHFTLCLAYVLLLSKAYCEAPDGSPVCTELFGEGLLMSPGYPEDSYANNVDECWILQATPGHVVKLSSPLDVRLEFSATCEFDFIRAFDDVNRIQQLGCRMCKDWSTPHPVMSTHDVMYVEFHSDFAVHEQGYMIGFTSANQTEADLAHQEAPPYYCDYNYGFPTRPPTHAISDCTEPRLEALLTHAMNYLRASSSRRLDRVFDAYSRVPGLDISTSSGIHDLTCFLSSISTREEAFMLAEPFIYNQDEDVMVDNYQNFIEILRSINLDELSQALVTGVELFDWILKTGFPVLPLRNTSYRETFQFFVQLQRDMPDRILQMIPRAGFLFYQPLVNEDEMSFLGSEFLTVKPTTWARVCHDVSNNTEALYDLFTTSREGQGLLREFKRMNDDPERAEEPIRYVHELYIPFVISVLEVWEELKTRGWTELV